MTKCIVLIMLFCFGVLNAAESLGVTVELSGVKIHLNQDWKMIHQGKVGHGEPEFTLRREGFFKEDEIYVYHNKNLLRAIKNRPSLKGVRMQFKRGYGFMLNIPLPKGYVSDGYKRYDVMIPGTGVYIMVNDLDLLNQIEIIGVK